MANTQVIPSSLKINDYIRFRVISLKDTGIYTGKVVGICNYDTARMYNSDVAALHLLMQQGYSMSRSKDADTLLDVRSQTFIVVECMDGVVRPFAYEWLMTVNEVYGYVELIVKGLVYNIRLYDVTQTEAANAATLLRNAGYTLKIIQTEE